MYYNPPNFMLQYREYAPALSCTYWADEGFLCASDVFKCFEVLILRSEYSPLFGIGSWSIVQAIALFFNTCPIFWPFILLCFYHFLKKLEEGVVCTGGNSLGLQRR